MNAASLEVSPREVHSADPAAVRSGGIRVLARWTRRLTLAIGTLFALAYFSLVGQRHLGSAPAFDDPAAFIDGTNCTISPDGKTAYVFLQHVGPLRYRDSVWAIDTETLERRPLPNAAGALHPLLPVNPQWISCAASWDGKSMLGALQMRGENNYSFFSIDLGTERTVSIDAKTFLAQANACGWRFEVVGSTGEGDSAHTRAWRDGEDAAAAFTIDTTREPAVPSAEPMQLFYTDPSGRVLQRDASSGEVRVLDLENKAQRSLRVSPDARWLALHLGHHSTLVFEVETGHSRTFEHSVHNPLSGDFPVVHRVSCSTNEWQLRSLSEDRTFTTDVPVGTLRAIDGDRFLGIDAKTEAAYVLDREGGLLKTLRAPVSVSTSKR